MLRALPAPPWGLDEAGKALFFTAPLKYRLTFEILRPLWDLWKWLPLQRDPLQRARGSPMALLNQGTKPGPGRSCHRGREMPGLQGDLEQELPNPTALWVLTGTKQAQTKSQGAIPREEERWTLPQTPPWVDTRPSASREVDFCRGGGEQPPSRQRVSKKRSSHRDPEGETGLLRGQHQQGGHRITHTDFYRDAGTGRDPHCPPLPTPALQGWEHWLQRWEHWLPFQGPGAGGRFPGAGSPAGRRGDMHTGPALLPRAGKGREKEEEEEERLHHHLSSSGWFRRLGRHTGTPPALGISGTTAGREERG